MSKPLRAARLALGLAPLLAVLASQLLPRSAATLPLFSREQHTACAECHAPSPRLNATGQAFLRQGYRTADSSVTPLWKSRGIPVAVVGIVGVASTMSGLPAAERHQDFDDREKLERAMTLHSAGTLAQDVSFDVDVDRQEIGRAIKTRSASIQFDDLVKADGLNFKAGVSQVELPYLSDARRLTLRHYLAPVTLAARGFEINGSGNGLAVAGGLTTGGRNHLEDSYLTLQENARGQQFGARMLFDRQNSNPSLPRLTWLQHIQAEAAGSFRLGRWIATPGYVFDRFDDRPAAGIHDRHQYYMMELLGWLDARQRWLLASRYEHEYRTRTVHSPEEDHQLAVLNVSRYLNPGTRVGVELAHTGDNTSGPRVNTLDGFLEVAF